MDRNKVEVSTNTPIKVEGSLILIEDPKIIEVKNLKRKDEDRIEAFEDSKGKIKHIAAGKFDLNKFPEEEEIFDDLELQKTFGKMLKILLPKFY